MTDPVLIRKTGKIYEGSKIIARINNSGGKMETPSGPVRVRDLVSDDGLKEEIDCWKAENAGKKWVVSAVGCFQVRPLS
jgi:hypothetical protein